MTAARVTAERFSADPVRADPVSADRVGADRVSADRVGADRVGADRVGADPAGIREDAAEREHDVLLLGATGITGRIALAYLAVRAATTGQTWAVGARDVGRVLELCRRGGIDAPRVYEVDAGDAGSLASFAARGRVLINLVGPYTTAGNAVVEACVRSATSYVDLTGETQFIRRTDAAWHAAAIDAGIAIVQTAGFEALPADLAVELARSTLQRRGRSLIAADVTVSVMSAPAATASDAVSGGTVQSILQVFADREAPELGDVAFRVGAADREPVRRRSPLRLWPRVRAGSIIAPMVPVAFINPPVLHRTAWLHAKEAGERFVPLCYREGTPFGSVRGIRGAVTLLAAFASAAFQATTLAAGGLPHPARATIARALGRILPVSGTGPSGPALDDWRWELRMRGISDAGTAIETKIDATGHPGYSTTARMITELALILADGSGTGRSGCITPALAVGAHSVDRFAAAGMHFTVGNAATRADSRG